MTLKRHHEGFCQIRSGDGNYVYHISIIDYICTYNLNKKLERAAKVVLHSTGLRHGDPDEVSVIHPEVYQKRFMQFVKKVVFRNI